MRPCSALSQNRRAARGQAAASEHRCMNKRSALVRASVFSALAALWWVSAVAGQSSPAPVIVVETSKGTFSFDTYPDEAPQTVRHIVELVRSGFYDGQRFHRVVPGFVVQWGDPQSRDRTKEASWGRGPAAPSGKPIGVAEITKKRMHTKGAVGLSHFGNPTLADSQIYVTLVKRDDLDGKGGGFVDVGAG